MPKKLGKKPSSSPTGARLGLTRSVAAALKRAGEAAAYRYCCGTGRGSGNQTVKSYAWREGYRVRIDEGRVIVVYQMDFGWHEASRAKIERKTREFAALLESAGLVCFVTEGGFVHVVGKSERIERKKRERAEPPPLWSAKI